MPIKFKRVLVAIVLCMILLGFGFMVWACGIYLAEKFSCSVEVFDWIATFLCFGGFLSLCIAGDMNCKENERRSNQ